MLPADGGHAPQDLDRGIVIDPIVNHRERTLRGDPLAPAAELGKTAAGRAQHAAVDQLIDALEGLRVREVGEGAVELE